MSNYDKLFARGLGALVGIGAVGTRTVVDLGVISATFLDSAGEFGTSATPRIFGPLIDVSGAFMSAWSIISLFIFITTSILLFLVVEDVFINQGNEAVAIYSIIWATAYIVPIVAGTISIGTIVLNVVFALICAFTATAGIPAIQAKL